MMPHKLQNMTLWHNDAIALGQYSTMAVWQYGSTAVRQYGTTAIWRGCLSHKL